MAGSLVRTAIGGLGLLLSSVGFGQSFNIDFDVFFGEPYIGNGAPSATFGAAAGQPGFWNRVPHVNGQPIPLSDLGGSASAVTILKQSDNPGGTGGFHFQGNTGDYALLLNDAEQVATLIDGGTLTYTISGLGPAMYDVYTYAVSPIGAIVAAPIYVPEATQSNVQIVTGPMPGNEFDYLITHSIHRLESIGGDFQIIVTQPPNLPTGIYVNGLQIVAVPEPLTYAPILIGIVFYLVGNKMKVKRG